MNSALEHLIDQGLTICETDLKDPSSDKTAVRRTRAALQEAKYITRSHFPTSRQIAPVGSQNGLNVPPRAAGQADLTGCICVKDKAGVIAARGASCPVHNG